MAARSSPPDIRSTARRGTERAQDLLDEGLRWCDTPREVAQAADIVITSLPDDDALESVASGPDGILAGLAAGRSGST